MNRSLARGLSYIGHPIFVLSFGLVFIVNNNPYAFSFSNDKAKTLVLLSVTMISLFFPLVSIGMMKSLGLIESLEMREKSERIGPLLATGIFYTWLFITLKSNTIVSPVFVAFVLGCTLGVFLGFFANNFRKISLHGIGMGGLIAGLIWMRFCGSYSDFIVPLGFTTVVFNVDMLISLVIVLAGLVCTARLALNAHDSKELAIGVMLGVVAQSLAFLIYL